MSAIHFEENVTEVARLIAAEKFSAAAVHLRRLIHLFSEEVVLREQLAEVYAKLGNPILAGYMTISQIFKQFSVHPNQISKWKKQFLESLPQIFDKSKQSSAEEGEELTNHCYQQIGQLKVELDWLKKNLPFSVRVRRELVEPDNEKILVLRQCELLGLHRTGLCYRPRTESIEDGKLMRLIDQ